MNPLYKVTLPVLLPLLIFIGAVFSYSALIASDTSTATHKTSFLLLNTSGAVDTDAVIPLEIFVQSLVDGSFVSGDMLNAEVHEETTDIVFMPGSLAIQVLAAFNNAGTNETTAAQNATANDITLPTTGSGVFEFAFDHQAKSLRLDIGTAADASWTVTWEYYDGSSYNAFSNVTDGTSNFTNDGLRTVTWSIPSAWTRNSLHSIQGFWVRARISAVTSLTTVPVGTQASYETGRVWTYTAEVDEDEQLEYVLYTGGSTDFQTYHNYFPGSAGITTPDSATAEVTGGFSFGLRGVFAVGVTGSSTGTSACFVCKDGAIRLYQSGRSAITSKATGAGTTTISLSSIDRPTTEQTIILADNGTHTVLMYSAAGMGVSGSQTVVDNANSWTFVSNGTTYYSNSIRLDQKTPAIFSLRTSFSDFNAGTHTNTQAYTGILGLDNE